MKNMKIRAFAAVLAAVMTAAAFAGCASSEGKDGEIKKASTDSAGSASGDHAGEKKVEVFLDEENNPYYYDANGKKMLLFAMDYDDQLAEDELGDIKESFIYNNYDNNGLSFTIPQGWFVEDTYGTPTMYKDADDIDAIDYNNCISIVPANFMLNYDMEKDKKVDKKYIKKYFDSFVENGFYESYEITATGEGALGKEAADMYDITVTYKNEDDGSPDLPIEKSRTIIYATRNKNCFIAAIKVPTDDEKLAEEYVNTFKSFAETITLPSEEQTKKFLEQFAHDPTEVVLDDEGADLNGDDFEVTIDGGTDSEDVELPE